MVIFHRRDRAVQRLDRAVGIRKQLIEGALAVGGGGLQTVVKGDARGIDHVRDDLAGFGKQYGVGFGSANVQGCKISGCHDDCSLFLTFLCVFALIAYIIPHFCSSVNISATVFSPFFVRIFEYR